jgi:hypothetical protein
MVNLLSRLGPKTNLEREEILAQRWRWMLWQLPHYVK